MELRPAPHRLLITVALVATWLIWGSTFLAIHFALDALPPLFMMGSRFVVAGLVACSIGWWLTRGSSRNLTLRHWAHAGLIGLGLVTIGMGATGWAATRLPTGVAALLVASAPLWVVALSISVLRARIVGLTLAGLGIGVAGVGLLVLPTGGAHGIDPVAAGVLVLANAAWAGASLFAPRALVHTNLALGCGMQMLTGGATLLAVSAGAGELGRIHLDTIGAGAAGSWLYLVLAGSVVGFLAYGWLLGHVATSTAATHAFVNPVVAIILGALVLAEPVGGRTVVAAFAVVSAVALMLLADRNAATVSAESTASDRSRRTSRRAARAPMLARTTRHGTGWSPAPTPVFAARREARPWQATDGMDALAIDSAFDDMQ